MRQTLIILQGPSGSGKSTLAETIRLGCDWEQGRAAYIGTHVPFFVCSTDDYFMKNGMYTFDRKLLGENHRRNQERVRYLLRNGQGVIVDNTNIRCYEAKPYVQMAVDLKVPVLFIRCTGQWQNIHGVPEDVVSRMASEMEELTVAKCLASKAPWEA